MMLESAYNKGVGKSRHLQITHSLFDLRRRINVAHGCFLRRLTDILEIAQEACTDSTISEWAAMSRWLPR